MPGKIPAAKDIIRCLMNEWRQVKYAYYLHNYFIFSSYSAYRKTMGAQRRR
jgi:hypothetical protein